MKIIATFFKSRFAHRIVFLFIACALVPMVILAILSFIQVSSQLDENEENRLHESALAESGSILARMKIIDDEMESIITNLNVDPYFPETIKEEKWYDSLLDRYESLSLVSSDSEPVSRILGDSGTIPVFSDIQKEQVRSGDTFIMTVHHQGSPSSIFVVKPLDQETAPGTALMAEIKHLYIIGIEEDYTADLAINKTVIDNNHIVYSTLPPEHGNDILNSMPPPPVIARSFLWEHGNEEFLSSSTPLYLRSIFKAPTWTLVLSESLDGIHAPVNSFKYTFVLVLFTVLFVVILLSINQIRKNLIPLERLKQGTRNLSNGDLSFRVEVDSGDEFEDLADSFNVMAETLDNQFKTLRTMTGIDRAILSVIDTENIIDTFIKRVSDIFPCDSVSICLYDRTPDNTWHNYTKDIVHSGKKIARSIRIPNDELVHLRREREYLVLDNIQPLPVYLEDISSQGMQSYLVFPILLKDRVSAIVVLANREHKEYSKDTIFLARQIVDRMAVALSNANLVDDLNRLNWGTLTALARVVDAKSPWTAGHSERVADIAVRIGEVMGLSYQEKEMLNKAGLLHDIGKVSTPRSILDKDGKLTDEEYRIIKEHPEQGVRILEPIAPYRDLIPIVLQHHERYDGKGYPYGISGRDITLCARILCVADSFDAMVSDRPYRKGKSVKRVLDEIKNEAGRQFDPKVVDALLKISNEEMNVEECA